ncbi:MAG: DNA topoisomerase, partial [Lachnospiraceae bacterium]
AGGASATANAQGAASAGLASALANAQGAASSDVVSGSSGTVGKSRLGTVSSNAASASGKPGEAGESNLILSPLLYKENGFHRREDAEELIRKLREVRPQEGIVTAVSRKKEKKNPPLLYNLAELQNDCSKMFKISPDQTLSIAQELYEKKMTTYPRTDARVLSSAVAKVIDRNLKGLQNFTPVRAFAGEILEGTAWKNIGKSRYTNDKAITDHYAIIPTGAGLSAYNSLSPTAKRVYETICRRFLAIFYPPAVYDKTALTIQLGRESFFANFRVLVDPGYLKVLGMPGKRTQTEGENSSTNYTASRLSPEEASMNTGASGLSSGMVSANAGEPGSLAESIYVNNGNQLQIGPTGTDMENTASGYLPVQEGTEARRSANDIAKGVPLPREENQELSLAAGEKLAKLRKGSKLPVDDLFVKEGETSPPKRYTSGSIILAMENAGQLIEDESLREMIRGSGIGTSATRAEILKKLIKIGYLHLNAKTQVITPELLGEMVCDTVSVSIRPLLSPELTASWEKGLTGVAEGTISEEEYMEKLTGFVRRRTDAVKTLGNQSQLRAAYQEAAKYYAKPAAKAKAPSRQTSGTRRKTGKES